MHTHRDSCHLTLSQTVLFDLTLTILVAKALLNVAWPHITIANCAISNGHTLKYNKLMCRKLLYYVTLTYVPISQEHYPSVKQLSAHV